MNEFIQALEQIQKEKGIDKEIVFEAIEASLVTACKKNFGTSQSDYGSREGDRQGFCPEDRR